MKPPFFDRLQTVFLICLLILLLIGILLTEVTAEMQREEENTARRLGRLSRNGFQNILKSEAEHLAFLCFATHGYGSIPFSVIFSSPKESR